MQRLSTLLACSCESERKRQRSAVLIDSRPRTNSVPFVGQSDCPIALSLPHLKVSNFFPHLRFNVRHTRSLFKSRSTVFSRAEHVPAYYLAPYLPFWFISYSCELYQRECANKLISLGKLYLPAPFGHSVEQKARRVRARETLRNAPLAVRSEGGAPTGDKIIGKGEARC